MDNVFLIGNGFDLHHMLPTKYFDFMCVADHLKSNALVPSLNVGEIFSKCGKSTNIKKCYNAHEEVFNNLEVPFEKANEIIKLLQDNLWFVYFLKTLDVDSGWIDFEKEISTVITTLDQIINQDKNVVYLSQHESLPRFILSNFKFFIDVIDDIDISPFVCHDASYDIKRQYLKEYPHNSNIYIADKKKIFEVLYKQLLDFSKALSIYLSCFVENAFDLLQKDDYTKHHRIDILNLADNAVSFNYTNTLERLYFDKKAYHIHGTVGNGNIVLGVNPNESDNCGTDNTSLIKFKKYYQREVFGTATEYIEWYRETIGMGTDYRVITIGHSLDETDKDILSDMFFNAKEIYITYYDKDCKDNYINNIIKIFGNDGYNKFKKEKGLKFVPLSDIEQLREKIAPAPIKIYYSDG